MTIFRACDIRGVYPKDLNESIIKDIGKAFATLNPGKIVVSSDVRLSSPSLKKAFIEGLRESGADVIDIGTVTTPMSLFATTFLKASGGAMITASHNPKEFNGIKLCDKDGVPISFESGLSKIKAIVEEKSFKKAKKLGSLTEKNIFNDYANFIEKNFKGKINLKIIVDAGNGVSGLIYPKILEKLGANVIRLYCDPDGNFPNHIPNPDKEENMIDLEAKVKETGADLGVAYDGDGDRVGFVDENGKMVPVNKSFILLIKDVLAKNPGAKIVYDVECSKVIDDAIRQDGGVPIVCKTGHTYITQKIIQDGAVFAGEKSAHYYFKETKGVDDGLFATLRLIEYLSEKKQKLSKAVQGLPEYMSAYRRIPVPEERKFDMVRQIAEELVKLGHKPITIDGARVDFPAGWCLIRASNTEPKLSVTYEASTKEEFGRIENFVNGILSKVGAI